MTQQSQMVKKKNEKHENKKIAMRVQKFLKILLQNEKTSLHITLNFKEYSNLNKYYIYLCFQSTCKLIHQDPINIIV